jgi:hypothetical protein
MYTDVYILDMLARKRFALWQSEPLAARRFRITAARANRARSSNPARRRSRCARMVRFQGIDQLLKIPVDNCAQLMMYDPLLMCLPCFNFPATRP